jgi:hypothetical protein
MLLPFLVICVWRQAFKKLLEGNLDSIQSIRKVQVQKFAKELAFVPCHFAYILDKVTFS